MIAATCELELDGVLLPSTPLDAALGRPVALDPLTIEWGRNSTADQPDTETCGFTVRVFAPPADVLDIVHTGTDVQVWAAGDVPTGGAGAGAYVDPGFDTLPDGPAPAGRVVVDNGAARVAAHTVVVDPTGPPSSVTFPPAAFTSNPTGWDAIPAAAPGEVWSVSVSVTVPAGVPYTVTLTAWSTPAAGPGRLLTPTWHTPPAMVGTGGPQPLELAATLAGDTPPGGWIGAGITIDTGFGRWVDQTAMWADAAGTWADAPRSFVVDTADVLPPAVTRRRVLVHSGRVSDITWKSAGDTAIDLDLVSVDISAPLGNTVIGDTPWPVQTVEDRAATILALTGGPVGFAVDDTIAPTLISWRDVDAQAALGLLQDVAQSAGGVLWPATHSTTGPFLWIEDPRNRAAVRAFLSDPDTGAIIITNPRGGPVDTLSACDLLRDPVRWAQTPAEVVTVVDVSWQEQTVDDDGLPSPTERHEIRVDTAARDHYGTNRMSLGTELVSAADAGALADRLLAGSSTLAWVVSGLTLDTTLIDDTIDSLDDGTRMTCLLDLLDGTTRIGLALTVIDLPAYTPAGDSTGVYVEGGSYAYTGDGWVCSLRLSPSPGGGGQGARWSDVPAVPGWEWSAWSGVRWVDCYGTTIDAGAVA